MDLKRLLYAVMAVGLLAVAAPVGIGAVDIPFPGGLPSTQGAEVQLAASSSGATARVDGRELGVSRVVADPEQTAIGYEVLGRTEDGEFLTIAPRPRLVLLDGTVATLIGNASAGSRGTLVFPGLPPGVHEMTLELDGVRFQNADVARRFALSLVVDNRRAYESSARSDVAASTGPGRLSFTVTSVSRTPSLVVVRGRFESMSPDEIQSLGRPEVWLTSGQARVESESGRLGFGDGYREFEIRFPKVPPGEATLELQGFEGVDHLPPDAAGMTLALRIP